MKLNICKKTPAVRGVMGAMLRIYDCPEKLEAALEARLTYKNPDYENAARFSPWGARNMPAFVRLLERYEDHIAIPRGFDFESLGPEMRKLWDSIVWEDNRSEAPIVYPPFRVKLHEEQKKAVEMFRKEVTELGGSRPFGSALLVMPTAAGKTLGQAACASLTQQRAMVLCKTNLIRRSWEKDLELLYGFKKKDLGIIQQKKFVLGKHITLASIATLSRRKHLWAEIFSQIGLLIVDEAQIIGSETIRDITYSCGTKYVVGMSATPTRRDKKHYFVFNALGKPILRIINKQEETVSSLPLADATLVRTMYAFKDTDMMEQVRKEREAGMVVKEPSYSFNPEIHTHMELMEQMTQDPDRNALIVSKVREDWKAGHCVLVACPRVKQAQELFRTFRKMKMTPHILIGGQGNAYMDSVVDSMMEGKSRLLVATSQVIKLGANINPLSRLHVTYVPGASDLEQLIGRIRRKHKTKKDAKLTLYYDLEDDYLRTKVKTVFYPLMRKLQVPRYKEMYVA